MSIFCRHRWELQGASRDVDGWGSGWYTTLLYRCFRCGRLKTKRIDGVWTLKDGKLESK